MLYYGQKKDKKGKLTQLNPVRGQSHKAFSLIPSDIFGDKHLASPCLTFCYGV